MDLRPSLLTVYAFVTNDKMTSDNSKAINVGYTNTWFCYTHDFLADWITEPSEYARMKEHIAYTECKLEPVLIFGNPYAREQIDMLIQVLKQMREAHISPDASTCTPCPFEGIAHVMQTMQLTDFGDNHFEWFKVDQDGNQTHLFH